jgi:hypothetical protein
MTEPRFLAAEMIYQPRPTEARAQRVFDANLNARLRALRTGDHLLLLCNSEAAAESLRPRLRDYAYLTPSWSLVTPSNSPSPSTERELEGEVKTTPYRCDWDAPQTWRQMAMSDRWTRILYALQAASQFDVDYLLLPALDAVYARDLLLQLAQVSRASRLPCAVSPVCRLAHHTSTGAPQAVIDLHNAAFDRAPLVNVCSEGGQGFWGKLGLLPIGVCLLLPQEVAVEAWEDDLEIDRALSAMGSPATCLPVEDPALYHLAPPVFDEASVRRIIERHLHYSLKIPGEKRSHLHSAPSPASLAKATTDPAYAHALAQADALIAECEAEMRARVARYGASWVDWGAYRYVARPADPAVEVWQRGSGLL